MQVLRDKVRNLMTDNLGKFTDMLGVLSPEGMGNLVIGVDNNQSESIGHNKNIEVGNNHHEVIGGNMTLMVGPNILQKGVTAAMKVVRDKVRNLMTDNLGKFTDMLGFCRRRAWAKAISSLAWGRTRRRR